MDAASNEMRLHRLNWIVVLPGFVLTAYHMDWFGSMDWGATSSEFQGLHWMQFCICMEGSYKIWKARKAMYRLRCVQIQSQNSFVLHQSVSFRLWMRRRRRLQHLHTARHSTVHKRYGATIIECTTVRQAALIGAFVREDRGSIYW